MSTKAVNVAPDSTQTQKARRKFSDPSWAWPPKRRDLLLKAALLADDSAARAILRHWLAQYDLDEIKFADHRLLAAIFERHGVALNDLPEYARLKGLQRQLWTQSRIRLHEALPLLQKLEASGITIMLLKGAARVALKASTLRQRASQDVDILVREDQMAKAAQILTFNGWQTARGDTAFSAIARAPATRAINFQLPPWGDIDLHRQAYHGHHNNDEMDRNLWLEAKPAVFFGLSVLVPSPEERLAMTLSHGAFSPDSHSDWLMDAAEILNSGDLDWARASNIFTKRKIVLQTQIGLSYLQSELNMNLPKEVEDQLASVSPENTITRIGTMLSARAPKELNRFQRALRKLWLNYTKSKHLTNIASTTKPLKLTYAKRQRREVSTPKSAYKEVSLPSLSSARSHVEDEVVFSVKVAFEAPEVMRRVEFELNSEFENIARFRVISMGYKKGLVYAQLRARIKVDKNAGNLYLEARPGKLILPGASSAEITKYAAVPFQIIE